ncbi:short-chain dehydrogenase, partial [Amycolatopsis sp. SID8362]|nr:short-chain dehydrogenase [Amycolatopsis sp. SID8362]NED48267.1 short-chain dehydrogenase [Amycolatopsis sp. SID8362]
MTSAVAKARLVWGLGVLAMSRRLPIPRKVAVVLAARHLLQAAATLRRPDGVVARWGWTADVAHGVSMLGLAAVSPRWRAAATANAVVA